MSSTSDKLTHLHERVEALQRQLAIPPASVQERQFAEALQGLQMALQELDTAEAELAQQNEELLATRERLEIERHRYRDLFEMSPDAYLVTDASGIIQEGNRAASVLLNASSLTLAGKPIMVFSAREERPRFRDILREVRGGGPLREVELMLQPYHRPEPLSALVTVVRDEQQLGRPVRLRWIVRDISERRAAEAALRESEERLRHSQRLESIGRLAGGIAHSFNNLLAAIGFHSELLLERMSEADRAHVEEIQKAGERAASLASQLLAFSRRQVLQPRLLYLDRVIEEMAPMLRRLLGEDVDLQLELDPGAGAVEVDLGQLEQVILNLVVNARDAMPYGGRLTLATTRAEVSADAVAGNLEPGPYVRLTVSDNGVGMESEVLAHTFEPFFTTKERGKGTGLGLATVHGIVLQSGGDVRVESVPGRGTTFTILLPRADGKPEGPERPRAADRPVHGSEVILLVEDEDNIRRPAVEILEGKGYTVLAAGSGAEALQLAEERSGSIDLVITDVVMPGMSGSQLADTLRRLRPGIRVLYMSGYPEDAIAHHGVLGGDQRFLQKPFGGGVLLQTVREILESSDG